MYSRIVHPTDFSTESLPALRAAHNLAEKIGAELTVCFFASPPVAAQTDTITNPETGETRDIAVELEALEPTRPKLSRDLKILITEKSTSLKRLVGFLEDMGADLLVMGMHRRTGIAGWFGHSYTEDVIRNAKCAVLVVKQDEETVQNESVAAATPDSDSE